MWDVELPIEGCCPECGADLATTVRIRATAEWIARYRQDTRLARGINRSVTQRVLERHSARCAASAASSARSPRRERFAATA
jgi:hypothetical protein